ncbi:MAG: hypothetical protein KAS32_23915 [Candidatus Peribacteraceae bacterium]|nr:hypothetical protein [Candidatus Peribacteraceae bacterium]
MIPADYQLDMGELYYKEGRHNLIFVWLNDKWRRSTMLSDQFHEELKLYEEQINQLAHWVVYTCEKEEQAVPGARYLFTSTERESHPQILEQFYSSILSDDLTPIGVLEKNDTPRITKLKRML